jgi:hypothetical protein
MARLADRDVKHGCAIVPRFFITPPNPYRSAYRAESDQQYATAEQEERDNRHKAQENDLNNKHISPIKGKRTSYFSCSLSGSEPPKDAPRPTFLVSQRPLTRQSNPMTPVPMNQSLAPTGAFALMVNCTKVLPTNIISPPTMYRGERPFWFIFNSPMLFPVQ